MRAPAHDIAASAPQPLYTLKIGVLHEGLLDSEFSLTEVRVLYELAHRSGASASTLASELNLDAGYLSRILKRFEAYRYLVRKAEDTDARRRTMRLTARGRRAFATLDARSREDVAKLVGPLSDSQRHRVVDAMEAIRTALDAEETSAARVIRAATAPATSVGSCSATANSIQVSTAGTRTQKPSCTDRREFVQKLDPARERCWIGGTPDAESAACSSCARPRRSRSCAAAGGTRSRGWSRPALVDECIRLRDAPAIADWRCGRRPTRCRTPSTRPPASNWRAKNGTAALATIPLPKLTPL